MIMTTNLMNPRLDASRLQAAPRCAAMSKRSRMRCQAPAVKGKAVCRFHGAGAGAPTGQANGAWRHGTASAEAIAERRALRALLREARKMLNLVK